VTTLCATVMADCACEALRRAARAISKVYAGSLADFGLTMTQLAILVATRQRGSLPLSRLAEGLRLDRTSLHRAVRPLERQGYPQILPARTPRERVATVTGKGERLLREALPIWESTQRRLVEAVGPRTWATRSSGLKQVVSVARALDASGATRRRRGGATKQKSMESRSGPTGSLIMCIHHKPKE